MNTLIVYAPNVRYLLKFPLFSPFSRFWEIRIIVATRFETFSIAVFVLEEWFPLAKFHRSFVFAPLLHFKTPRLSPLYRYRSNLWRASFFFRQKEKETRQRPVPVRSSTFVTVFKRYLGPPWSGETRRDGKRCLGREESRRNSRTVKPNRNCTAS